jgi:CRP-like cAMP-binding protein
MSKAVVILGELSDRDIDWMLANGSKQELPKEQVLITEGQPLNALYIVIDGTLKVYVASLGNREIGTIASGEVLGEMSFVDGRLPSATVKAIEDSVILSIPRQKLTEKLEQDVLFSLRFYRAITKFLSTRLRGTVSRLGSEPDLLYEELENDEFSSEIKESSLTDNSRFALLIERLKKA